ncbi:MAG: N-6 DNA methylase [Verrucomicrobiota bacterium]
MPDETYRDIINDIARTKSSAVTVFSDFCRMAACALAANSREDEYFEAIKPYSKDELKKFTQAMALLIAEMEKSPFSDILGPYYTEIAAHSSKQARGEFYTPPEICELMASIAVDIEATKTKGLPISVNEPCCGSGGMVLALAKFFAPDSVDLLRVTCQDINPVAVDMCYINTTLWGIPANIILGNTLHMTIDKSWRNFHWHRVGEDQRQSIDQMMDLLKNPPAISESEKTESANSQPQSRHPNPDGQFELDLGMLADNEHSK